MRFERCYVQPLCTPTRVGLMTGMSNARNYIEFGNMEPKSTTFGNLLKNAGYATAIAGKWQLGHDKDLPQRFGFDESCLWQHTRRPPRYANPGLEYNGVERDFNNGEYGPDLVSDFALKFIDEEQIEAVLPLLPDDAHARALPANARQPRLGSESTRRASQSRQQTLRRHGRLHGQARRQSRHQARRPETPRQHAHPLPRRQRHRQRRRTRNFAASTIRAAKATPTPAACTSR